MTLKIDITGMPRGYIKNVDGIDQIMHPATSGMWGNAEQIRMRRGAIPLGIDGDAKGYSDDRHLITFAGSRSGKGVSLVVPTLCQYEGSVLAIDPKGELATITAARRGRGSDYAEGMNGAVYVLDPFKRATGAATEYRAAFNPLAQLDPDTDEGLMRATLIADGLIVQETGTGGHFTATARSFLRGLILYICASKSGEERALPTIRTLISQPKPDFEVMLDHMREIGGVIGRAASTLQLKSENERASVISTADVQTDFLEDGAMHQVLTGHDFDLEDLKRQAPATVYLCLPAGRLATHGRWLRLMVALAMEAMEETGPLEGDALPVLFCLDEFAALGHMSTIEKAAGQIAGFGVKLWPILQDVTQLKRDYPASWETFIGNAGMVTAFGVSDISTTEYLSKMLGKTMIAAPNMSDGINTPYSLGGGGSKSSSTSIGYQIANLLDPHEVAACFRRESYLILCIPAGYQPFPLYRNLYYKQLIGYFDPAPGHEPPPTLAELQGERDREAATKKQVAAAKREEQEREDQWLRDEEERKRQAREKLDTSKYRLILVFGGWGRLARALAVPSVH